ncbi:hypothetical protein [Mucilaginibacter boryungensis]|uniref:Uncharacterized protein n=1 Tax=Mucilaginibacter boryungensis TaxID=768480 RepID=A0ABR9XLP3_9SPHI|nr:hypothetical protein [Mucilaginibacter boryungensis]MBE9667930.1 hypothetical protein [Mucilaginibacter boryungensis]
MKFNLSKPYLITLLTAITAINTSAQKLPSEQKESFYAPPGLKIDGKTTEWGNKFQAHNNATMLFYTMANDNDNLYLVMQTDQQAATDKIFHGGITLEVICRDKGKKLKPVKITFPLVSLTERSEIVPLRDKKNNADSVAAVVNARLQTFAKHIAIEGLDGLTDPDVSVYNDLGLKAAARVDGSRAVSFEFQVPLKYIRSLMGDESSFDYRIIVNGAKLEPGTIVINGSSLSGGAARVSLSGSADANPIFSPTYLKASYILAKKQR